MIGFDVGTYNLVCATKDDQKNFVYRREVNAFLKMPLKDRFVFNMMQKAGVPLIERGDVAYALGEASIKMAYSMSDLELSRPMQNGCVNPKEKDAFEIMNIMIHSLITNVKRDKEILYYSIPANALNEETDAEYHQRILQSIFNAFESESGYKVDAHPINEGLALVYAELRDKKYTGISISCGAGQVNICFAMFGMPLFQFSIVNSGDWIDKQAAKATGESPTFINQEKMRINLGKQPSGMVERAIQTQYKIMIENTLNTIKKGIELNDKKANINQEIDIVVAGGVSMPEGFLTLFKEILEQVKMSIKISNVFMPADPLYSVARGCLSAAENSI